MPSGNWPPFRPTHSRQSAESCASEPCQNQTGSLDRREEVGAKDLGETHDWAFVSLCSESLWRPAFSGKAEGHDASFGSETTLDRGAGSKMEFDPAPDICEADLGT